MKKQKFAGTVFTLSTVLGWAGAGAASMWTDVNCRGLISQTGHDHVTDLSVTRWRGGYKMYFKTEDQSTNAGGPERPRPAKRGRVGLGTHPSPPLDAQGRLNRNRPGPWDNDVLVYRVGSDRAVEKLATFERAGVPTLARLKDGRLIAAHQYFPEQDEANFDKVAVHFSSDEGKSWTSPQVIRLAGLPKGMRFPFDPTLVPLPDGLLRLYFTSLYGPRFEEDVPAIYSAISSDGVDYTFEPGMRFGIKGGIVIDCAVVLHRGVFHLYSPDNGLWRQPGERLGGDAVDLGPRNGVGYHAVSQDGLRFTRVDDVRIDGHRQWL
ncbi:MAG: exo-alpha-sialidase, partial [Phycisphaerales bacterium]